ncbi:MAG TPA: hypothetical protein VFJ52_05255, partial [Terriglobia bacterium]|nr:hypothetical protein [Terriglobia bacterium]
MAGFWPQPEGKGRNFPIASSLVAKIHPVFVTPHSSHSKKFAPFAAALIVLTGPRVFYPKRAEQAKEKKNAPEIAPARSFSAQALATF